MKKKKKNTVNCIPVHTIQPNFYSFSLPSQGPVLPRGPFSLAEAQGCMLGAPKSPSCSAAPAIVRRKSNGFARRPASGVWRKKPFGPPFVRLGAGGRRRGRATRQAAAGQ